MKKILISVFGAGLLLTSCSSDEPMIPGNGTEQQVTFTINVPEAMGTRAGEYVNSAKGGVTNGAGELNYTVALYNQQTGAIVWSSTKPESTTATTATFTPTVVLGYEYKIVAYATFDDTAVEVSKFGKVATREVINDESEDAYFHNGTILGAPQMAATLKRPFGKLRLVAEDYDDIKALGLDVESVTVTYKNGVKNTFDALESLKFSGEGKAVYESGKTNYSDELNGNEYTVFADYLPADSSETEDFYSFDITVTYKDNKGQVTRTFSQDIPVKRNHLTTLRGNFFTTQAQLTLTVEEMFADETVKELYKWYGGIAENVEEIDGVYTINSGEDLAWLAQEVNAGNDFKGKTVKLGNSLDLNNLEWTPIGTSNNVFKGTFDGQGNKISNLKITGKNSNVGLFGFTKEGEIKNLILENAEVSGYLNVAAVAGSPYTSKYNNITVRGLVKINGFAYVGSVGGKNAYTDWNNVTVNVEAGSYVNANSIDGTTNYRTYVGGVVGFNGEGGHSFTNISSNIDVIGTTCDVGGLFGIAHYGNKFENCVCTGDVTITSATEIGDAQEIGGIAGVWHNKNDVIMNNCSFTGALKATYNGVELSTSDYYYGGLVGKPYNTTGDGKLIIDGVEAVPTLSDLRVLLANGGSVVLATDLAGKALAGGYSSNNFAGAVLAGGVFDGAGHTFTVTDADGQYDANTHVTGGTLKDINLVGGFKGVQVVAAQNVVLDGVTILPNSGITYALNVCGGDASKTVIVKNSTLCGWSSWSVVGLVKFENCVFGNNNNPGDDDYNHGVAPWVNTVFEGCSFTKQYYMDFSKLHYSGAATVKFVNCTVDGVKLTAENHAELINGTWEDYDKYQDYITFE